MKEGTVVWLTGLPASGKSTLAGLVAALLGEQGSCSCVLDGDDVRAAIGVFGYDEPGREAFYRALARLAALLAQQGLSVLVPATAHRKVWRDAARAIAPRFVEVFVDTPPAVCAQRDPKSLYAAAYAGRAPSLPGVGLPYERPEAPDVVASGGKDAAAAARIVRLIEPRRKAFAGRA